MDKGCVKRRKFSEIGTAVIDVDDKGADEAWESIAVREQFLKTQTLLGSSAPKIPTLKEELEMEDRKQHSGVLEENDSRIEDAIHAVAITLAIEKLEQGNLN